MEQPNYEDQEQLAEAACGGQGEQDTNTFDSYEDLYGKLAQKDRDLVLAAELGKALLESNQELQRRYDSMHEEYSIKVESLTQEKYNLHLETEKLETEHQNKLKDLQDDISTLRQQLQSSSQHQHDTEAETSRALHETKQKADYLVEQVQQATKLGEELKQELESEKAKNETSLCVIQDHLEHINMLREQVEFLSEKLKETTEALLRVQDERDKLLAKNEKNFEKLKCLEETVDSRDETIKGHDSHVKQLEAQIQSKAKKTVPQMTKQQSLKCHSSSSTVAYNQYSKSKGRGNTRHMSLEQPHCYSETISSSSQLAPLSPLVTDQEMNTPDLSLSPLQRDGFGSTENLRQSLPPESSLLTEFSTTIRHRRNKSDCSVVSISEGSRKRHHETIAGESDDEAETSDKNSKGSVCKQTIYSELMDCSSDFVPISSKRDPPSKPNLPMDLDDVPDSSRSKFLTPPPEQVFDSSHSSPSHSLPGSTSFTPSDDDNDVIDNLVQNSHISNITREWGYHAPVSREASLFDELSSKLTDLDRQNSNTSEKSLFDELSTQMKHQNSDTTSSCLLGHPDFYSSSRSEGHDSCGQGARQSEDENSYTSEWPLLTSVSADMLDGDDFECDDDDFLVGNVAGSTLSIGDSGVGIMLNSFSGKTDASDVITRRSLEYHRGDSWSGRMDMEFADKQDLKEACRLMQDLVDRLHGDDEYSQDLSSPENELPSYGIKGDVSFDQLFSLIKKARQCVDNMDHPGVSRLRKFSARQWQLADMEPMEDFKIPGIPVIECTNHRGGHTFSQASLPTWTKRKELKRSSSSSSLSLRRSI